MVNAVQRDRIEKSVSKALGIMHSFSVGVFEDMSIEVHRDTDIRLDQLEALADEFHTRKIHVECIGNNKPKLCIVVKDWTFMEEFSA